MNNQVVNFDAFYVRDANEVTPSEEEEPVTVREWVQYFARKRKKNQSKENIKDWVRYFSRENSGMLVEFSCSVTSINIQGDHFRCSQPPIDTKTKVPF